MTERTSDALRTSRLVRESGVVRPLLPLLEYQKRDIESPARFSWCCWSRQIGKSFTKSLRRLLRGIERRRTQVFLSAGERQSRELMLKVRQHCRALNLAAGFQGSVFFAGTRFRQLTIELPNGVRVIGLPANATTARGFSGDVFLDEFAMHGDDREIWAAVFPTVLRGGGELDVASTPKGCDNLFAELRDNDQFAHSIVTLDDAIAAGLEIDAGQIRRSMNDDELYRQEFGCEFLDEASSFLTYEQIRRVEDPGLEKGFDLGLLGACKGPLYVGVDIGRHRDLTVMWVVERCEGVLITRGVRESQGELFRGQCEVLSRLLELRPVCRCCIDAGGMGMPLAEAVVERFGSARVEAVQFSAMVKDSLASGLRLCVEEGTIRIPADELIRNDWHSVRRSVAVVGPARYEAARSGSGHADRFWAACLAVRAAACDGGAIEVVRGEGLRFARKGIW
ncbi:MAG TPA: terminase family protein [Phycisphaerae bacterium]|nr:terminase family protein [Phycisphaerae bacterium]HRY67585.1 terminase family protein [Phycisphaerae bacterium]HSA24972.1 terminase family protein [Phycisphaerae bacterium]